MNVTWVFVVYAISGIAPPQSIEVKTAGFYDSVLECARESVIYNNSPLENKIVSACMPIVSKKDATTKN
jgi:hypothetical protein